MFIQTSVKELLSVILLVEILYSVRKFKRRVAVKLVQPYIHTAMRRYWFNKTIIPAVFVESDRSDDADNMEMNKILENANKKKTHCYLCKLVEEDLKQNWTCYGCSEFQKGFHVNCFTV